MIKSLFKIFYNNILSICYDTQKKTQDDIIIDFNKYENINIDYKIQQKHNNNTLLQKYNNNLMTTKVDELDNEKYNNNTLFDIEKQTLNQDNNSFDECYNSDIEDKYDIMSDFD
tara:strand:+ start:3906 stop:4247 length:342 start_codon:yes stop_codon:yes gene_type:complete